MKTNSKTIKSRGSSTGEVSVINFMDKVFKTQFKKVRPNWLVNPKTNKNLELDGYSQELGIAIEYGSHLKSSKSARFFSNQEYIKYKDELKIKLCKKQGIKLIHIHDLNFRSPTVKQDIYKTVANELNRLEIKIPLSLYATKFTIQNVGNAYSAADVWKIAKSCKSRTQFEVAYNGLYGASIRLGIEPQIKKYFNKKNPSKNIVEEKNFKNISKRAKECKTRTEFSKKYSKHYQAAICLNILDKVCSHMFSVQKPNGYWNKKENVVAELIKAKSNSTPYSKLPYACRDSIKKNNFSNLVPKYINLAKKSLNVLKQTKQRLHAQFKECQQKVKSCKGRNDFQTKHGHLYNVARANNWIGLLFKEPSLRAKGLAHSNEFIAQTVNKYKDFHQFRLNHPSMAKQLKKRGILTSFKIS